MEGNIVTYGVTIKNLSDKNSKDIISDLLPQGVVIIESDCKIDRQKVTWKKDAINNNEEFIVNLKVKFGDKNSNITPPEVDNLSTDTKPIEGSIKPTVKLPNTGGVNVTLLIGSGWILIASGNILFNVFNKNVMEELTKYVKYNGPFIDYNNAEWSKYDSEELDNIINNHVINNDALIFIMGGRYLGANIEVYEGMNYNTDEIFDAHGLINFYGYIK